MTLLGMFGPQEIIIVLGIMLGLLLLPLIALIDILRSDFQGNNKLVWVIVVIFFNVLGAILYFLIGRDQKIRRLN